MRDIENYAMPYITALMRGDRIILEPAHHYAVAAFLSLVAVRIDISNGTAHAVPPTDYQTLIRRREPGPSWKIWMKYVEGPGDDYAYRHFPMALKSFPIGKFETLSAAEIAAGPDDTNTQVTTIVVGRLCARIFSSTVYDDFVR